MCSLYHDCECHCGFNAFYRIGVTNLDIKKVDLSHAPQMLPRLQNYVFNRIHYDSFAQLKKLQMIPFSAPIPRLDNVHRACIVNDLWIKNLKKDVRKLKLKAYMKKIWKATRLALYSIWYTLILVASIDLCLRTRSINESITDLKERTEILEGRACPL